MSSFMVPYLQEQARQAQAEKDKVRLKTRSGTKKGAGISENVYAAIRATRDKKGLTTGDPVTDRLSKKSSPKKAGNIGPSNDFVNAKSVTGA